MEGKLCRELLRHTLANVALVYSSLGGRYHSGPAIVIEYRTRSKGGFRSMVTKCFPYISRESCLNGDSDRYEGMNRPFALEKEHLSLLGPHWGQ